MMPLHLYLIRHGETAWSISGQHTGRTDIPLTPQGEDQARGLACRLRGIAFSHVLTSPSRRARRTCELAELERKAEIEPDLAEWDYGDYEGQRSVDIRQGRPDWSIFRDGCPHGETPSQVSDRADRLIKRFYTLDENVAIFSHGQFGCVLAAIYVNRGLDPSLATPVEAWALCSEPSCEVAGRGEFRGGSLPQAGDVAGLITRVLPPRRSPRRGWAP